VGFREEQQASAWILHILVLFDTLSGRLRVMRARTKRMRNSYFYFLFFFGSGAINGLLKG